MPTTHTFGVCNIGDRAREDNIRCARRFATDLAVLPVHTGRCRQCFSHSLFRSKASGQRLEAELAFGRGKQPFTQFWSAFQLPLESSQVNHVYTNANDHAW